ncbi:MAG: rhomboid family intramembrane serine protease [Acidimicrobiales bacterium]
MQPSSYPPPAPPPQACYRHPDRPAGVICQRCDRPICPQCMHQASVGFHCPECTKAGAQKVYQGVGSLRSAPVLTQALIGLNVLVFLLGAIVSRDQVSEYFQGSITQFHVDFSVIGTAWIRGDFLYSGPVPGAEAIGVGNGEWYRLVTSGFLHYGVFHLAINMWALWVLGQAVEQYGGRARLAAIYAVALLCGSFGGLLVSPDSFGAGASGAIFGLMGAMFIVLRVQGIPWRGSPLLNVLILNLVITFAFSGISKGAHVVGLVGGAIAAWAMFELPRRPGVSKAVPWAVCAGVALASVVASIAVA